MEGVCSKKDHLGDPDIDGRIILRRWDVGV
jgi:hypothetical protein